MRNLDNASGVIWMDSVVVNFNICLECSKKQEWINSVLDKVTHHNTKQSYHVAQFISRPKLVTFLCQRWAYRIEGCMTSFETFYCPIKLKFIQTLQTN